MTLNDMQRRLTQLREACADKPKHAEFRAVLEDATPGEPLEDLVPSGIARNAAAALIADFEWIVAPAPKPGMHRSPFPCAYQALRLKQARAASQASKTREANTTWAGFSFGGK